VEETARPACIVAINAYHRDHMAPLVVCSRTIEYEATAERCRLALQRAVVVQPLTSEHVDAYLVQAGKPLAALRSALKKNAALRDLATIPLMLNILILTYQGSSVRGISNRQSLLLQQVWDNYVQRMVERQGNSKRYSLSQVRAWLSWLARLMREHNQTVFYLEYLQPDWLTNGQRQANVWLAFHLPATVIGASINILVQLFLLGSTDPSSLLQYGILGGLLGGLWRGPRSKQESGGRQNHLWGKRLTISVFIVLIYELSFGFRLSASSGGIALCGLLLQYFLTRPSHPHTFSGSGAGRRWQRMARLWSAVQGSRALLIAAITGLSFALSNGLYQGQGLDLIIEHYFRLYDGLYYALSFGLSHGLSFGLISLTLGAQIGNISLTERLRWTKESVSRGLFNPKHLRIAVLFASIILIFVVMSILLSSGLSLVLGNGQFFILNTGRGGVMYSPVTIDSLSVVLNVTLGKALGDGLGFGLGYWFLLGLFQGISHERIEDQDRRFTNQGIHHALRNSVVMGIIGGGTIGYIGVLSLVLGGRLSSWLNYLLNYLSSWLYQPNETVLMFYEQADKLSYGLLLGISGSLLISIVLGGLSVWQHYITRLLLHLYRSFPWKASRFLDDASALFLLRRVGGGYSFPHRLLLDHLANAETGATSSPNASSTEFPDP